jgi:MerR family transcriptional regulator, copper efflux regulator
VADLGWISPFLGMLSSYRDSGPYCSISTPKDPGTPSRPKGLTLKLTSRFTLSCVNGLQVSELAQLSGMAPSTVRFYERIGLLSSARRAPNGYREFDPSALDELAFINRAKGIGMSLEEISELVACWPKGECRLLQARLRGFLSERIDQVRQQRLGLADFERQLERVLGRLSARDPGREPCGKGCGCESDLDLVDNPTPWGCTLRPSELSTRIQDWRDIAESAVARARTGDSVRLLFTMEGDLLATLTELCQNEVECCPHLQFTLDISAGALSLVVRSADEGEMLEVLVPSGRTDEVAAPTNRRP